MPFRRRSELVPGIDLPDRWARVLRERFEQAAQGLEGEARVIVVGCDHAARVATMEIPGVAAVSLPSEQALRYRKGFRVEPQLR